MPTVREVKMSQLAHREPPPVPGMDLLRLANAAFALPADAAGPVLVPPAQPRSLVAAFCAAGHSSDCAENAERIRVAKCTQFDGRRQS